MTKVLNLCYFFKCIMTFDFGEFGYVTVAVRSTKLGRWTEVSIPWSDTTDEVIYQVVKDAINKLEAGMGVGEIK